MCGVVAVLGRHGQGVPGPAVEAAMQALAHRGPDDAGSYASGNIAFGFRRLAIIDLSAGGHQPMVSPDGELALVFNGEIYNHVELRAELAGLGHRFRSSSDTEVLLHAYRQWGPDCVHRFNGMWAFVIHELSTRTLFGARDRLGVKPLYYWHDDAWFVLASEPRAIAATGLTSLQPDFSRLADSIAWDLMDHEAGTCLAGIRQIPAGHRFRVDARGTMAQDRYWELPREQARPDTQPAQAWIEQLGGFVTDAVRLRLRSDVPVGFTLSGGIDSSMLICEAAQLGRGHEGLLAFSYQDRRFDEREPIRDTVAQTGARLVSLGDDALDLAELLPKIVHANGEPVHSMSAAANFALFDLARHEGVKVMLGGQGADEVLGGYSSFQSDYWHTLASDGRFGALFEDIRAFARLHGHGALATLFGTLKRSVRIGLAETQLYRAVRGRSRAALPSTPTTNLFTQEFLAQAGPAPMPRGRQFRLSATQRQAVTNWPLPMYLRIEDRSSMAHSVEARLPFTDYRLVEHAFRMPDELKYARGLNKLALRQVAAARVPSSVVSRVRKLGFPVGAGAAAHRRLHTLCADLAASRSFRERGIYDLHAVQKLLAAGEPAQKEHSEGLFQLAQTELWLRDLSPPATMAGARAAA